jgi:hypothetical protein
LRRLRAQSILKPDVELRSGGQLAQG